MSAADVPLDLGRARILFKWNGENPVGWFLGTVLKRAPTSDELRRCPTANCVVKYTKRETGGELSGYAPADLSMAVYGGEMK